MVLVKITAADFSQAHCSVKNSKVYCSRKNGRQIHFSLEYCYTLFGTMQPLQSYTVQSCTLQYTWLQHTWLQCIWMLFLWLKCLHYYIRNELDLNFQDLGMWYLLLQFTWLQYKGLQCNDCSVLGCSVCIVWDRIY